MPPDLHRFARARATISAAVLTALVVVGCGGAAFDPSAPCTTDGRAAGAYPSLEALVPRDLDGAAPTTVDSGRNCNPSSLASLITHGVTELRFAGSTWETGSNSGVTIALFEAAGLRADWVHEFYRTGAESARNTESVESSTVTIDGAPGFRVDTLNGEAYQTVVDWQEGDRVRVVLVSSFIREVQTKERHEEVVAGAIDAAVSAAPH